MIDLKKNKIPVIAASILILILLTLIIFLLVFSVNKREKEVPAKVISVDPNALWLLEEPLPLPSIQFSRKQRKIWSQDEFNYWYKGFSKEDIEKLKEENRKIIEKLLESAP